MVETRNSVKKRNNFLSIAAIIIVAGLAYLPLQALRVRRPVPPSLAPSSSDWLATGSLTGENVLTR